MKPELQKQLYTKYPAIFAQKDLPMSQTCMCWGIDCGDGWYWLIDNLSGAIQQYCDGHNEGVRVRNAARANHSFQKLFYKIKRFFHIGRRDYLFDMEDEKDLQVEAVQVKEKFGGLRFYISGGGEAVDGMISLAEHLSYKICEWCGTLKEVKVYSEGWTRTLCPKCNKNWKEGKRPE